MVPFLAGMAVAVASQCGEVDLWAEAFPLIVEELDERPCMFGEGVEDRPLEAGRRCLEAGNADPAAILTVGVLGDPSDVAQLAPLALAGSWAAVDALGFIRGPDALVALKLDACRRAFRERRRALSALAASPEPELEPFFRAHLRAEFDEAQLGLARLGAWDDLIELMEDETLSWPPSSGRSTGWGRAVAMDPDPAGAGTRWLLDRLEGGNDDALEALLLQRNPAGCPRLARALEDGERTHRRFRLAKHCDGDTDVLRVLQAMLVGPDMEHRSDALEALARARHPSWTTAFWAGLAHLEGPHRYAPLRIFAHYHRWEDAPEGVSALRALSREPDTRDAARQALTDWRRRARAPTRTAKPRPCLWSSDSPARVVALGYAPPDRWLQGSVHTWKAGRAEEAVVRLLALGPVAAVRETLGPWLVAAPHEVWAAARSRYDWPECRSEYSHRSEAHAEAVADLVGRRWDRLHPGQLHALGRLDGWPLALDRLLEWYELAGEGATRDRIASRLSMIRPVPAEVRSLLPALPAVPEAVAEARRERAIAARACFLHPGDVWPDQAAERQRLADLLAADPGSRATALQLVALLAPRAPDGCWSPSSRAPVTWREILEIPSVQSELRRKIDLGVTFCFVEEEATVHFLVDHPGAERALARALPLHALDDTLNDIVGDLPRARRSRVEALMLEALRDEPALVWSLGPWWGPLDWIPRRKLARAARRARRVDYIGAPPG